MHPPINIPIDFNEVIQKHKMLQDINSKGLLKNVISIAPIIKKFHIIIPYKDQTLPKLLILVIVNYHLF
jgi:hypothetical protein